MNEYLNTFYSEKILKKTSSATTSTSLEKYYSDDINYCISRNKIEHEKFEIMESSNINMLPKKQNLRIDDKNSVVSVEDFNNNFKYSKYAFKEDMDKKISAMYVLNFIQNENMFENLKSLIYQDSDDQNEDIEMIRTNGKTKKMSKLSNDCRYMYIIIENPLNKGETIELGLKIVDMIHQV